MAPPHPSHRVIVTLPLTHFTGETNDEPDAYTVLHDGETFVGNSLDTVLLKTATFEWPTPSEGWTYSWNLGTDHCGTDITGPVTTTAVIRLVPVRFPTAQDAHNQLILDHLTPDLDAVESTVPDSFIVTQMLTELTDESKDTVITVTSADCHTNVTGTLIDFHADYLHPDAPHIEGKVTLFFKGRITVTANLFDNFTTYSL